jgi:hypothetical protein
MTDAKFFFDLFAICRLTRFRRFSHRNSTASERPAPDEGGHFPAIDADSSRTGWPNPL